MSPLEQHTGPIVDTIGSYTIIECLECGFRHVAPLPSDDEIERWYRDHHYSDSTRDRIDYYERDRDWWLIAFRDIYATIEQHVPSDWRNLIDVGCGTGIFLEVGSKQSWNVVGYEPNHVAAEHCRKKNLTIVESSFPSGATNNVQAVDVIHMRNVLEHVTNPKALVQAAMDRLNPEGLLVVGVPNDYNPLQRAVRIVNDVRPWWLAPPHHLNYFNFESLERFLLRSGLELVTRYTSFPIDIFLAMGDNYVDNPALGRSCHLRRVRFEQTMETAGETRTRRLLYHAIASAGLGRDAIVIARRPR
ncbi:MAG: class I SAM-dependent methyltransferase [Dongiaceae bacterium]